MQIKIKNKEILSYLKIEKPEFPTYVSPLINFANFYARGTVPEVVGQMTELIQQFPGDSLSEWEEWYLAQNPDGILKAIEKILQKLEELSDILNKIDKATVEKWVRDLVIVKTFVGLKFQQVILRKAAELMKCSFNVSKPEEESKGIDGYIGETPVSIKPHTYEAKPSLPESIGVKIIYYEKMKDGIKIDLTDLIAPD